MNILDLTDRTLEPAIIDHPTLFVGFWSGHCDACRSTVPAYEAVAAAHPDVTFARVDPATYPDVVASFQVVTLPTLVVFRDTILVYAQAGPISQRTLESIVDKIAAIDMEGIRRTIDAQRAALA